MTREEQFREMAKTLLDLVGTIDVTGGVSYNAAGEPEPAGDPEWIDLGEVYLRAKAVIAEVDRLRARTVEMCDCVRATGIIGETLAYVDANYPKCGGAGAVVAEGEA